MTRSNKIESEVLKDSTSFARRVADWLLTTALVKPGRFGVVLSGGETPRPIYELLCKSPYREGFPWARTHWFWGDERFVPAQDARSNYRMAWEAMLSRAPVPAVNIHAIVTDGMTPDEAAARYECDLKSFHGTDRLDAATPLFDVTLLGLGSDGHTASLFPGTSVLEERHKWVAAVLDGPSEARITLTYPALESSRVKVFLVAGSEKRDVLQRFSRGDRHLPAAQLGGLGKTRLFADAAAAGTP